MSNAKKLLENYQKLLTKGQIPKAIEVLEQVVQLLPKDANHRKKLADLYLRAKRNAEAFSAYEMVARGFADGGFYLKAIAVYRQMQKIDPSQPAVYERLAELNQKQGLMGQALSDYGELVSVLEKTGRHAEVAGILEKMVKLDPSNLGVRIRVAESYCRSGNKERGLEELNEISKELRKKGDLGTLRKLYELFMRQFPEDLSVQAGMARSLISSGDPARALQLLQGLLKKSPDNVDVLGNLANAYRATKDHENERLTFKQLIKLNPDALDFHKGYARACLDAGAPEKALEHLEQCKPLFSAPEQQKALVSYYEKLLEMLPREERIVGALRELYGVTGQQRKIEDLGALQEDFSEGQDLGGFDQEVEELEPLEELEEFEPLEELEELEELDTVEELEAVEDFEPLDEETDFDMLSEAGSGEIDFSAANETLESASDDFGGFDLQEETELADAGMPVADDDLDFDADEDAEAPGTLSTGKAGIDVATDVPIEESLLDLELEIDFDVESDEELAGAGFTAGPEADEATPGEGETEELSLDVELDLSLDEEPVLEEEAGEIDLDVDLGDFGEVEDLPADEVSATGDALSPPATLEAEGDSDVEVEELEYGGTLDLDLDLDAGAAEPPTEEDDDLGFETNSFELSDLDVDVSSEEEPEVEGVADFLESGLETLADIQAVMASEVGDAAEGFAPSFSPQRDVIAELEEAEFYIHQGLFDEAEGVCHALAQDFPEAPEIAAKLEEIAAHRQQSHAAPAEEDEGFFDLASELSNESVFDAGREMESLDERDLSRLDGILAEFKKGIESQIDQEDTESHFNLGIAYKEMGLLDDAISEFDRVMRDPERIVDCLTLIGICHAEKGDFAMSEESFRRGLDAPQATDADKVSLHFELGIIYEANGQTAAAIDSYRYVEKHRPGFRDVAGKLAALGAGNNSEAGADSESGGGNSRISFV